MTDQAPADEPDESEEAQQDVMAMDRIVVALVTLRLTTPYGEWLNDTDFSTYASLLDDAEQRAAVGGIGWPEDLILTFMNYMSYALEVLAMEARDGRLTAQQWLQEIAAEREAQSPPSD